MIIRLLTLPLDLTPNCVLDKIDSVIDFALDLIFEPEESFEYAYSTTPQYPPQP